MGETKLKLFKEKQAKDKAADVNDSKGIWKVKSVSACLALQTKSMAEISKSEGRVIPWCILFHCLCAAVSCGEAADISKGQRVEP